MIALLRKVRWMINHTYKQRGVNLSRDYKVTVILSDFLNASAEIQLHQCTTHLHHSHATDLLWLLFMSVFLKVSLTGPIIKECKLATFPEGPYCTCANTGLLMCYERNLLFDVQKLHRLLGCMTL